MTTVGKNSRKETAVSFLRLVVAGRIREAYAAYVRPDMRHHNMAFPGDAASLEKAMEENHVKYPHKVFDVKRTIEDGNLVAVHSHVRLRKNEPGFAAVHIFRFEGDRIAELWDIGQPVPADSPNGNGMF
jgi:predicted SnoaL-like aldol condensation-catalyzing enzyme